MFPFANMNLFKFINFHIGYIDNIVPVDVSDKLTHFSR